MSLALAAPASAQLPQLPGSGPTPQPYQANDGGGFRDILPPGTRGRYNALELAGFLANGTTVPHCCDQLGMYRDLVYATPGLTAADIPKYFKDSSFGVKPANVERTYSPRSDVTIVRDKAFGVPHVYGRTRDGAMFGLGYAGAEDRLFFMDVLRHSGRGQLSSFAGGSNAAMDAEQWEVAPYTEADLKRQADQPAGALGHQGDVLRRDVDNYIAGINRYIAEARLNPTLMPGEYAAIGRPQGPDNWKREDVIATASLVGGIFGRGGGNELAWSEVADAFDDRFGKRRGAAVFGDFRAAEDRAAPVTVLGKKRFPYQARPKRPRGVARPDPGSLRTHEVVTAGASAAGLSLSRAAFPPSASNALLISGRESASGHPLMVAGPQVAYFNPQILMEQDVHAPAAPGLPGIDAQGASFVGVNLYVQLGRGRDYAWSATSAGQDNIDTFALDLCEPGGAKPTINSMHYRFRGQCLPIEVLERHEPVGSDARRSDAARAADAARRAHEDGPDRGARDGPRQAGRVRQAALDLLPRGRLGGGLHGLQHARGRPRPAQLPACRRQDRLHVQLVLLGLQAHRVLQLRRQPGPRQAHERRLPGAGAATSGAAGTRTRGWRGSPASSATRG